MPNQAHHLEHDQIRVNRLKVQKVLNYMQKGGRIEKGAH